MRMMKSRETARATTSEKLGPRGTCVSTAGGIVSMGVRCGGRNAALPLGGLLHVGGHVWSHIRDGSGAGGDRGGGGDGSDLLLQTAGGGAFAMRGQCFPGKGVEEQ